MEYYKTIDFAKWKLNQKIKKGYDQTIYTFDIETSAGYIFPGSDIVTEFDKSKPPEYYSECTKVGLCYLWQFGIGDQYYYGRELTDFLEILEFMKKLPGKKIIWVHNLGFEESFLLNLFFPEKIFARRAHEIIYMEYSEDIIFRCSFQLTHMALATWAKDLHMEKLPDYDYIKIRTPHTPLTDFELKYGQRDLEIVNAGIKKMLEMYKFIQKIPLTQTGRVRKPTNDLFKNDVSYRFRMARLLPRNAGEYALQRLAYSGGNVHANWYYAGQIMEGVSSCDIASSYPFCCLSELLPMKPWRKAKKKPDFYINDPSFCTLLELRLVAIKSSGYIDYLSYSKLYDIDKDDKGREKVLVENGRVVACQGASITVTGVDYEVIRQAYDGKIDIIKCWYSKGGYLDPRYMDFILKLYENKTSLKGIPEKEDIYMYNKQLLNSVYGDFASAIVYDDTVLLNDGKWDEIRKGAAAINERLDYLRQKPWRLKSSFSWGLFITAAARRNHFQILKALDKHNHVVYYDTDSVYYLGDHDADIKRYNKEMTERIDNVLTIQGLDPERSRPKDRKGIARQMGILEIEHRNLPAFKALRAKCYAYIDEDGKMHSTISGVNKIAGAEALQGDLNNLHDGTEFDYDECRRLVSHYNVDQPECWWTGEDGRPYKSKYKYGLALQPSRYKVNLGGDFVEMLLFLGMLSSSFAGKTVDQLMEIRKEYLKE